jgi:GxxExxY protein
MTERGAGIQVQELNQISQEIIGAAIVVHSELGPGLLESVYEECLAYELTLRNISFERQKPVPVMYKGKQIDCGFRLDLLISDSIVVELKTVEQILPVHQAQLMTYLKLTGCKLGLILNFNVEKMVKGIKRMVNHL